MNTSTDFLGLFLPADHFTDLHFDRQEIGKWRISGHSQCVQAHCPLCGQVSNHIHSSYARQLKDLPYVGQPVELVMTIHRFRCSNPQCDRKIFCEPLLLAERYARMTHRLGEVVMLQGFLPKIA